MVRSSKSGSPPQGTGKRAPTAKPLGRLMTQIASIASTPDCTLLGLARAAGLEPARDFRNITLNGLPLADEDVSGFDFSGSDLRGTGIERARGRNRCRFDDAVFDGPSCDPKVISFNKTLRDASFGRCEQLMTEALEREERGYDVISFTTAIRKSPNLERAAHWFDAMQKAGVAPNDVTFNTLISKSATEERAAHWFDAMQKAGVAPDVHTFATLMNKSATEERAAQEARRLPPQFESE